MYARREGELTNTSLVDAEAVDEERFPLYSRARGTLTVLHAGDGKHSHIRTHTSPAL